VYLDALGVLSPSGSWSSRSTHSAPFGRCNANEFRNQLSMCRTQLVQTREAGASDAKNAVNVVRPGGAQAWNG
jgi:hypothetical protein